MLLIRRLRSEEDLCCRLSCPILTEAALRSRVGMAYRFDHISHMESSVMGATLGDKCQCSSFSFRRFCTFVILVDNKQIVFSYLLEIWLLGHWPWVSDLL
jgi:hypothetical protein